MYTLQASKSSDDNPDLYLHVYEEIQRELEDEGKEMLSPSRYAIHFSFVKTTFSLIWLISVYSKPSVDVHVKINVSEKNWIECMQNFDEQQLDAQVQWYYEHEQQNDSIVCPQCMNAQIAVQPCRVSCPNPECAFAYQTTVKWLFYYYMGDWLCEGALFLFCFYSVASYF